MITAAFVVTSVVGGAAAAGGAWLWGKVTSVHVHVRKLDERVTALEAKKPAPRGRKAAQ